MTLARSIDEIVAAVLGAPFRRERRARLIAVSGIDASGKGYLADRLAAKLKHKGLRVALIAADGWLNLPSIRYGGDVPGKHFYAHAFRFEEMFCRLINPLVRNGSVHLIANYTEEAAAEYREHLYAFEGVDLVLLEGIFLFRREYWERYDFRLWIECSFETALQRAIARSQEDLPPDKTVSAYENIYFPAQREHFDRDAPQNHAHMVYVNDPQHSGSAAHQADFFTTVRGISTTFPR